MINDASSLRLMILLPSSESSGTDGLVFSLCCVICIVLGLNFFGTCLDSYVVFDGFFVSDDHYRGYCITYKLQCKYIAYQTKSTSYRAFSFPALTE